MFALANFAVKGCKRTGGCSGSQHTPCIQKKIMEYFSKDDGTSENDCRTQLQKSRFLYSFSRSNLTEHYLPFVSCDVPI